MMGATKRGEILRTLEVCREIMQREGNTRRGILLLTYFLRDQGRPLDQLLEVWHAEITEEAGGTDDA